MEDKDVFLCYSKSIPPVKTLDNKLCMLTDAVYSTPKHVSQTIYMFVGVTM